MQPTVPATAPAVAPAAAPEQSFVQSLGTTASLIDSILQGPVRPPEPPAAPAVAEPPADPQVTPPAAIEVPPATEPEPDLEALMAEFRAQHPEATETVIKRLADKELHVRKQSKQITELLARVTKPAETAPRQPTAFELSLQAPAAAPAAVAPPVQPIVQAPPAQLPVQTATAAQQAPTLPAYMENPETAEAAYAEALGNGDYKLAGEIRQNIDSMLAYQRRTEIEALAEQKAQQIVQQQFGPLLPTLQQQAREAQANEALEFAVGELEARGVAGIREMFIPVDDSAIEADGKRWANTPMNQALTKYPFLRQIQVQHADPTTARRLTLIARYEAAAMMPRTAAPGPPVVPAEPVAPAAPTGIPADQVAALIQSGRTLAEREQADRVRLGLNAGPGATSSAGGSAPARFIDSLGGSTSNIMSEISNPAFLRRG